MVSKDTKPNKSSISPSDEDTKEVKSLKQCGISDAKIQAILEVLRVGKTPDRHNVATQYLIKFVQGHPVDRKISFPWWNIDYFIKALERISRLESAEQKIKDIKDIFKNKHGNEMTIGGIVQALEIDLKERDANKANWKRLWALQELLYINFMYAYLPNPIFIWRAYSLCRLIQLTLPPGLLNYLDEVWMRIEKIISEKADTTNPFRYALGMDQGKGQSYFSEARLFNRRWQAQFHPENDIYINDDPVDDRTLQRYRKWMKDFTKLKLSEMIPLPDQFLL